MQHLIFLLPVLLFLGAGPLAGQTSQPAPPAPVRPVPGTYTSYGTGCGAVQLPERYSYIRTSGRPVLGGTVIVSHQIPQPPWCYRGRSSGILLTGLSDRTAYGIPLPFPLHQLHPTAYPPTCLLYTSAEFATPLGLATFPIPNDLRLLGLRLYQQFVDIRMQSDCGPVTLFWTQVSDAGMMVIGLP